VVFENSISDASTWDSTLIDEMENCIKEEYEKREISSPPPNDKPNNRVQQFNRFTLNAIPKALVKGQF